MSTLEIFVRATVRLCLLVSLTLITVSCVSGDRGKLRVEARTESNARILVTFKDERSHRPPVADPLNGYRQRGDYENSTWSVRIAERLAEEYGLTPIEQWPIDVLEIHCVVYRLSGDQTLDDVISLLEKD